MADFLLAIGAGTIAGMILMLYVYRIQTKMPFPRDRAVVFWVLLIIAVSAIGAGAYLKSVQPSAETGAAPATRDPDPKGKYVGLWKAPRGKASIEIYEESGGLFAKFWQGDIMPLKFQQEGQYYEGSTALGAMPLIIRNDTLQYSQSKYIRAQD